MSAPGATKRDLGADVPWWLGASFRHQFRIENLNPDCKERKARESAPKLQPNQNNNAAQLCPFQPRFQLMVNDTEPEALVAGFFTVIVTLPA
jgi:hypothetical protein